MMKMEEDGIWIILYKRYKDNVNFLVKCMGELVVVEGQKRDRIVVNRVKCLAESIDSHLKVSTDVCSGHEDGQREPLEE